VKTRPIANGPDPGFVLAGGRRIHLRPLREDDGPALVSLGRRSTQEDLRLRFFHMIGEGDQGLLDRLTRLDPLRDAALVAYETGDATPLGVVRLHGDPATQSAEFAILVRADAQRFGLGLALMETVVELGSERGYRRITAPILPENGRMLRLARKLGFTLSRSPDGLVDAVLELEPEARSRASRGPARR
jgi:acetyltransferase